MQNFTTKSDLTQKLISGNQKTFEEFVKKKTDHANKIGFIS